MYISRNTQKQKVLIEQPRNIFTTSDLAVLWEISKQPTLLQTISRYTSRGILKRLARGIYSKKMIKDLHIYEIGCAVSGPQSYVSAETVLQEEGVINQYIEKVTLFGKKRKEFEINGVKYLCRYLNPKYLSNRKGVTQVDNYSKATVERAASDLLHINPNYYFDNPRLLDTSNVNLLMTEINYL